ELMEEIFQASRFLVQLVQRPALALRQLEDLRPEVGLGGDREGRPDAALARVLGLQVADAGKLAKPLRDTGAGRLDGQVGTAPCAGHQLVYRTVRDQEAAVDDEEARADVLDL